MLPGRPVRGMAPWMGWRGWDPSGSPWAHGLRLPPQGRAALARPRPADRCRCSRRRPALAASEFPAGYEGYHTYAEVGADVAAVAAAHPDIVQRFSIGQSYLGRQLWAAKISDNVAVDEDEPEVLFDGGTHADEHMGVEMTLHDPALARRRLRHRPADHDHRRHARGLDRLPASTPTAPRTTSPAASSTTGARTASRRRAPASIGHRPQPELRLPVGRRRPDEHEPAGHHVPRAEGVLGARRPGRCATSWPAASSAAGSRSGPPSRSTRPAGW